MTSLFKDIEIPLVDVLASMEMEGINLDENFLKSLSSDLSHDIEHLENLIYKEADTDFNLASPKQLGVVLFEKMKLIEKPKKTKTGQYATGEEVLSKLAAKHSIVKNILEWRGLVKLKNTYIDSLPNEVNATSGRKSFTPISAVAQPIFSFYCQILDFLTPDLYLLLAHCGELRKNNALGEHRRLQTQSLGLC